MEKNKGLCMICRKTGEIRLTSPSGKSKKYYCKEHYKNGEWIKEQHLFDNWKVEKVEL